MGPSQKRSQTPTSMEHQPRPSQPSAEALASQTKPGADDATANSDVSAFHVSDSEIVVLTQQRYFYLEKRGPFAQVAGPLWREFWSKAGHAFANATPLPGMWGAGFVDPAVEGDEKHVYRAGVTLPEDATDGTNLLDGIVTRGALLGDTGVDCRYCKFVVSGSYDHMSKAWEECFARTATSGFLPRSTAWCFEEYLNTPMDTPNPADLRTAIYIPVDENDNFYQIEGPTVVELKHDTFVHLEGTGEFSSIAPALFGAFHGEHTAVLPMDIMTGMWAGSLVRDNGQNVYRPGATFNCSPSELVAKLEGGALLPGATLGCVGDGKSYARFDVTAPFSSLGAAFGACLDRVDASTTLQRREGVFSWETYLSDPAVTKPNENRIDIYIPVETKKPSTGV